uniref:AcidPPc domain-containing protein n=1 Tax=Heterorhabditis bacteriophora TaxID=37862 RepID=A0A1I7WJ74_HETBA
MFYLIIIRIMILFVCDQPDVYITDFVCSGNNSKLIHESQLSFYSGHAAFSFYAAWFTSLYLQARLYRPLFSRLLLPVIQFSLFGGAAYVALTRVSLNKLFHVQNIHFSEINSHNLIQVSDYKHHWSDVLVGAIMGSAIGIFVANNYSITVVYKLQALFVAEVFKRREIPACSPFGVNEFGLIRQLLGFSN